MSDTVVGVVMGVGPEVTQADDAFLSIVGYTRAEFTSGGVNWRELTPPEYLHLDEAGIRQAASSGGFTVPYRKEFLRRDGTRVPVLLCCAFIAGSDRWVGYIVNLGSSPESRSGRATEFSNLDALLPERFYLRFISELVAERERLTQLLDSTSSPIWAVDTQLRLLSANQSFQAIQRKFSGKNLDVGESALSDRFSEELRRPWADWYKRALEGEQFVAHTAASPEHGNSRAFDQWVAPIRDGTGTIVGASVVSQDVSFRVRAEEAREEKRALEHRLIQLQKMEAIGQLAGGVAHDFNNILTSMLLQLEELLEEPQMPQSARAGLDELRSDANRAASLTRQLLLFSRRHVLQSRTLELNGLISGLVRMLSRLIGEHLELAFNATAEDLWFQGDSGMIEQILTNLVVNARDAMPAGGRVTIRPLSRDVAEEDAGRRNPQAHAGPYIGFEVIDQGHGIPPEQMPRIFEPFFTTKDEGRGTGLGLATAYGIAQQHQGWLEVESEPGKGCTFRLVLPAVPPPPQEATQTTRGKALVRAHGRVLLVEDESSVRQHLVRTLQRHGYEVVGVDDGPAALRAWSAASGAFDVVVSDMKMPGGITGRGLVEQMLTQKPGLKSVLISGYVPSADDRTFMENAGAVLLSKPFSADQFVSTVAQVLGRVDA